MRHRKSGRQLNRNSSHRKAMYRNMACSLFEHKVIKTTVPKAKELRRVVEPLITHAINNDNVAGRRHAFDRLRSDDAVAALFNEIAPASKDRNGGYTRILKCGFRTGDKAPMAFVELVDREDALPAAEPAKEKPAAKKAEKPAEVATGDFDADAAKAALGKKIKHNDLTMIEGIGPKISEIFITAGIDTWEKLGSADAEALKNILAVAGDRYKMHDPSTWSRQAEFAAKGEWKELADWQDKLEGGKEVE